jgi:hypothetical protein
MNDDIKKNYLIRGLGNLDTFNLGLGERTGAIERRELKYLEEELAKNLKEVEREGNTHGPTNKARIEDLLSNISELSGRIESARVSSAIVDIRNKSHIETIGRQFRKSVHVSMGSTADKETIARYQYSPENYSIASGVASNYTTSQITSRLNEIAENKYGLKQEIKKTAERISSPSLSDDKRQELEAKYTKDVIAHDEALKNEGIAKAGLAIQRRKKQDTASLIEGTEAIMAKHAVAKIAEDAASGKSGSVAEINKEFAASFEKLKESQAAYNEVLKSTTATLEEVATKEKALGQAKEDYEKKELQKEAASRGGGGGGWRDTAAVLGGMGSAAQAGGGIMRQWTVSREMDKMQLQTGYMDIVNRRFFDNVDAASGNAEAIARIRSGQHARSSAIAKRLGSNEVTAAGVEAIGGTLVVGATVAGGVAAHAATGGASTAVAGGNMVSGVASGVEQISGKVVKLESGAIKAQAQLAGYGASDVLGDAQRKISVYAQQIALDYTRNTTNATRGAGGGRRALLAGMRDVGFMQEMANREIDQAGMLSLMQAGTASLGAGFRGQADMKRAGDLSSSGLLSSPEEYIGLRAAGERGGVGASGLETILRNAVAAGMDNSKNIQEMVQGIGNIATVRGGVSTYGGAAANMGLAVQSMVADGMSKNMAAQAAVDLNQSTSAAASDRSLSVSNVVEIGQIMKRFPKLSPTAAQSLALMTPNQLKTVAQSIGTPDEQKVKASFGIDASFNKEDLVSAGEIQAEQAMGKMGMIGRDISGDKLLSDYSKGKYKPKKGSKEFFSLLTDYNQRAIVGGETQLSAEAFAALPGQFDPFAKPEEKGQQLNGPYAPDVGAKANAAAAGAGVTAYADGKSSVDSLVQTMTEASKVSGKEFNEAIKESSKELGGTLKALDTSVSNLKVTVDALNLKLGGKEPTLQEANPNQAKSWFPNAIWN